MRDDRLFLEVPVASRYVVRILENRLAPTGIPPYQLGLLTHIRHAQPVTPTEIATASGVPLTTLRDNVQRLVDRKLVRRVSNPRDGRSYLLKLTARGEETLRRADPALLDAYVALERRLPQSRERYEAMFEELNEALELALAELSPALDGAAAGGGD